MGRFFFLTCEMRHVVNLRSKKNSVKTKTNPFCYLPQLSSFKLKTKTQPGDLSRVQSQRSKRVPSKKEWWREVPGKPYLRKKRKNKTQTCSVRGAEFAAWRACFHFVWLISSPSPAEMSWLSANTIQIQWQVCRHLREPVHFYLHEGGAPTVDGGLRNAQARKGKNQRLQVDSL